MNLAQTLAAVRGFGSMPQILYFEVMLEAPEWFPAIEAVAETAEMDCEISKSGDFVRIRRRTGEQE